MTAEEVYAILKKQIQSGGVTPEQIQPDWNQNDSGAADYIKNRPFYENETVLAEWDGNTEGLVAATDSDGHIIAYKILGGALPGIQEFNVAVISDGTVVETTTKLDNTFFATISSDDPEITGAVGYTVYKDNYEGSEGTFPEAGLYAVYFREDNYTARFIDSGIVKLPNKYLNLDTALNKESENPVQNKAIAAATAKVPLMVRLSMGQGIRFSESYDTIEQALESRRPVIGIVDSDKGEDLVLPYFDDKNNTVYFDISSANMSWKYGKIGRSGGGYDATEYAADLPALTPDGRETNAGCVIIVGSTGTKYQLKKLTAEDVNALGKDNTTEYTPTGDYNPATKKYVDDKTGEMVEEVEITEPAYTNQIPKSVDITGAIYNSTGIKSGYALNSSGEETENASTCITGFIPVSKGDIIRIQDPGQSNFDTTLEVVLYQGLIESAENIGKTVADISANAVYGTISIEGNTVTWDTSGISYYFWDNFAYLRVMVHSADAIVTVNQEIKNEVTTQKQLASDIKVTRDNFDFNPEASELSGKKIVVFGDSIIGMVRDNTSVTAYAAAYTGADIYNVGFGGCRMSIHPTPGYAAFSMWALADAITSGDFSTQDTQASSGQDYFASQLEILKGIDFDAVDNIVIHYGTNDFGGGVIIDDSNDPDSTSTLCGALRYSLDKIVPKYPNARIYISVPIYRMWDGTGSDVYENSQGNTLPEYVDALKNVAREYHLPVIDGYYALGINSDNDGYYSSDGTHLSQPGREMFGNFIGGKLIGQGDTSNTEKDCDAATPRQQMTAEDTTVTLQPNTLYVFPEMATLEVTLAAPTNANIVNEYIFTFTSGSTATTLSLPDSVITDIAVEPNTYYECSIIDNHMVFHDWEVTT